MEEATSKINTKRRKELANNLPSRGPKRKIRSVRRRNSQGGRAAKDFKTREVRQRGLKKKFSGQKLGSPQETRETNRTP